MFDNRQKHIKLFTTVEIKLRIVFIEKSCVEIRKKKMTQNLFKSCTLQNDSIDPCPENSLCLQKSDVYKCVCLENYEINSEWQPDIKNSSTVVYCQRVLKKIYQRLPAKTEHLAFGILMVLLATVLLLLLIVIASRILKALKPIKRTKTAYTILKWQRDNIKPLKEEQHDNEYEMVDCKNLSTNIFRD